MRLKSEQIIKEERDYRDLNSKLSTYKQLMTVKPNTYYDGK